MSKRKNKNPASSAAKVIADLCGDPSIEKEIKRRIKKGEAVAAICRLKVWMLRNNDGDFLCYGSVLHKDGVDYHYDFPNSTEYLEAERFCFRETRRLARILADDANRNFREFAERRKLRMKAKKQFLKNTHAKPVQVEITWREL